MQEVIKSGFKTLSLSVLLTMVGIFSMGALNAQSKDSKESKSMESKSIEAYFGASRGVKSTTPTSSKDNIRLPQTDIAENVDPLVSIRSLYTGGLLSYDEDPNNLLEQNWIVREVNLPKDMARKYPFGVAQFANPAQPDICLIVRKDGKLDTSSCKLIRAGNYESAFSILPTASSAVQIESLSNNDNECLSAGNINAPTSFERFGVRDCEKDENSQIRLENLFNIGVPYVASKVIK
ncbi:hypothetical protein BKH43_01800 [Helicobacter sp. 13S00401-1]|uniref:toxin n=1 Tax=Helicobacter sp. 13S00401-1 TaxID=1905758 RepID=UPI000BA5D495|nr:toxin [Helicobacter sp. 13S00401-1]PAF51399.1 hypothetical protein BKH43_01800 [Helicobacter sp. 13S00401-1]